MKLTPEADIDDALGSRGNYVNCSRDTMQIKHCKQSSAIVH
jgi:hypothetical protein